MKNLHELDKYRVRSPQVAAYYGGFGGARAGVFRLRSVIDMATLAIVVSSDGGWEHVSVSRQNRCPNWVEMEQVKRLFFKEDETVMQLHVPVTDHISVHNYCLHLWRPTDQEIPRPPGWMVGGEVPSKAELDAYFKEKEKPNVKTTTDDLAGDGACDQDA